jgi:hypothetical protein
MPRLGRRVQALGLAWKWLGAFSQLHLGYLTAKEYLAGQLLRTRRRVLAGGQGISPARLGKLNCGHVIATRLHTSRILACRPRLVAVYVLGGHSLSANVSQLW